VREYEFTFVVQPEITDEGLTAICERYEGAVEQAGAIKLFYEDWGRRRLAYEIQKFQKGHYMVLHFLDVGKAIPELERISRQDDSIIRFLTVLANQSVEDIQARKEEAIALEEDRVKKAQERAVREAEETAARAAEAEARAAEIEANVAAKEAAAEAAKEAATEGAKEAATEGAAESVEASGEPVPDAEAAAEAPAEAAPAPEAPAAKAEEKTE
jgi:small subunit ribosomal protein S6